MATMPEFAVGDLCMAPYLPNFSKEARINKICEETGYKYALVTFTQYNAEDSFWLDELKSITNKTPASGPCSEEKVDEKVDEVIKESNPIPKTKQMNAKESNPMDTKASLISPQKEPVESSSPNNSEPPMASESLTTINEDDKKLLIESTADTTKEPSVKESVDFKKEMESLRQVITLLEESKQHSESKWKSIQNEIQELTLLLNQQTMSSNAKIDALNNKNQELMDKISYCKEVSMESDEESSDSTLVGKIGLSALNESQLKLIGQGPINIGRQHTLQPVLCYFPVPKKRNGKFFDPKPPKGKQTKYVSLLREIQDVYTPLDRIVDIYDEIKPRTLDMCSDEVGCKILSSMLIVSPGFISSSIVTLVWMGLSNCLKNEYGVALLIDSVKGFVLEGNKSLVEMEKAISSYGVLKLMLHKEGYRVVMIIIEYFKPTFLQEAILKFINELSLDPKGCLVLYKALSVYPHSVILPMVEFITNNMYNINSKSPQAALMYVGILNNHLNSEGVYQMDNCIENLQSFLSPDIKKSVKKLLNSFTSIDHSWF